MRGDTRTVVDSSVFAAILLREPGHEDNAERFYSLRSVHAPPFFRFEVANALWKQKNWEPENTEAALNVLFTLPVNESFSPEDATAAMAISRDYGHPFYDTASIAMAQLRNLPLWTLDKRQAAIAMACNVTTLGKRAG